MVRIAEDDAEVTEEWSLYFTYGPFGGPDELPMNDYPYNYKHEYKKKKQGETTEVWRRLKK